MATVRDLVVPYLNIDAYLTISAQMEEVSFTLLVPGKSWISVLEKSEQHCSL